MQVLQRDTYLTMIKNSEGSRMFRTLWAEVNGQRTDITKDGLISCAFYVSSILTHFKLLGSPHATVDGTIRDLERSGWRQSTQRELTPGCVVVWERAAELDGEEHLHIGFYLDAEHAMSHSDKERAPVVHGLRFNGRAIISMYTHPFLDGK